MTERDALLRAVCENPDDDTPRLVYADWLQENGDEPRAEFIRLQLKLAAAPGERRATEDVAREQSLLKDHVEEWLEPLKEFNAGTWAKYGNHFQRGFVEAIGTTVEVMAAQGERLFELAPVRELTFDDELDYAPLVRRKWLSRLHTLRLNTHGAIEEHAPAPLLRSRYLSNLTTLDLRAGGGEGHLNYAGVRALVASKSLKGLQALNLTGNCLSYFHEGSFEYFLSHADFPLLRELHLADMVLKDDEAEHLAGTPWLAQLRELDLHFNEIDEPGLRAILESPHIEKLERLDLSHGIERVEVVAPDHPINEVKQLLVERFGNRVRV